MTPEYYFYETSSNKVIIAISFCIISKAQDASSFELKHFGILRNRLQERHLSLQKLQNEMISYGEISVRNASNSKKYEVKLK